jgi:hypothetical protein
MVCIRLGNQVQWVEAIPQKTGALLEVFNNADVDLLEGLDLSRDRNGFHTASKLILYLSYTENLVVL